MKIRAEYKGAYDSLGYTNGKTYALKFGIMSPGDINYSHFPGHVYVHRLADPVGNRGLCVYSTLKKFLDNWDVK